MPDDTDRGVRAGSIGDRLEYAFTQDLIERPVKFGDVFKPPSRVDKRKHRAQQKRRHGKHLFSADEILKMVDSAGQQERRLRNTNGKRREGGLKIDQAKLVKQRYPDWNDAAVADEVGCNPSLLSRSSEYQDWATKVDAAVAHLPPKKSIS